MTAKVEDIAMHRQSRQKPARGQRSADRHAEPGKRRQKPGCPICRRPTVERYRPFCSARCADIDLGRWLNESYRVPAEEAERPGHADPADEDE